MNKIRLNRKCLLGRIPARVPINSVPVDHTNSVSPAAKVVNPCSWTWVI